MGDQQLMAWAALEGQQGSCEPALGHSSRRLTAVKGEGGRGEGMGRGGDKGAGGTTSEHRREGASPFAVWQRYSCCGPVAGQRIGHCMCYSMCITHG